jgi:hypothetical protein
MALAMFERLLLPPTGSPFASMLHYSLEAYLWIGPNQTRSGLHADDDPLNLLYQLHGTKTLWLYPPQLTSCCLSVPAHPTSYPAAPHLTGCVRAQLHKQPLRQWSTDLISQSVGQRRVPSHAVPPFRESPPPRGLVMLVWCNLAVAHRWALVGWRGTTQAQATVHRVRVDLVPGDVLFVPAGWMHYAESTSSSVSLSGRVQTPCELLSSWVSALHTLTCGE